MLKKGNKKLDNLTEDALLNENLELNKEALDQVAGGCEMAYKDMCDDLPKLSVLQRLGLSDKLSDRLSDIKDPDEKLARKDELAGVGEMERLADGIVKWGPKKKA